MKKLGTVNTFQFDKYLLLGFSKDWVAKFGELPSFDILLDKTGKLHLKSK